MQSITDLHGRLYVVGAQLFMQLCERLGREAHHNIIAQCHREYVVLAVCCQAAVHAGRAGKCIALGSLHSPGMGTQAELVAMVDKGAVLTGIGWCHVCDLSAVMCSP